MFCLQERLDALSKMLNKNQLDSILVMSPANIFYLSGYYTEPHERVIAAYINPKHDPLLIVPAMEEADAKNAGWRYDIIGYHDHEDPWDLFFDYLKKQETFPQTMGLEYDHTTLTQFKHIERMLPHTKTIDAQRLLADLRVIKNEHEHALLKQAAELADYGIETGMKAIREGINELELIAIIEYELKKQGVRDMSFSTMVLTGEKTASPHGTPGTRQMKKGDLVLFDLGVVYKGYCSDITRTAAFQSISDEQENIYKTVLTAGEKAIAACQTGIPLGEIDKTARTHIDEAGYGDYFTHRIGHGLGIETHEYPSLNSGNTLPLASGMSFTIEPGIYVPNTGGVRIEDMIFMTKKGPDVLTKYPKDLQIID
ncbi:MAG TPA: Xaa-Pro peptidase family protein [Bacillota bacterium]|nr:Xaa-Pro peptidase family protein [Bacillota bacterium]